MIEVEIAYEVNGRVQKATITGKQVRLSRGFGDCLLVKVDGLTDHVVPLARLVMVRRIRRPDAT
jgi:hypothetical protein